MRLVVDCFKLIKGAGKSIGIYNVAQGIVKHLGVFNVDTGNKEEIIVLGNSENKEDFDVPGVIFKEVTEYNPSKKIDVVMWELFFVSKYCKRLKADRVFFPRGFTALKNNIYDIVLIHDLIPFYYNKHFPGVFNRIENAYIMNRLKQSAKKARKVITISQASKQDIVNYCRVDDKKIIVINNACEEVSVQVEKNGKPYICAVTSGLPHKNAKGIIESYKKYCEKTDNPLELTVIGLSDVECYDLPKEVKRHITCHRFIKDTDAMYRIIGGAEMFLFLSLIEGFGLPPIEAMQLGVPVICSNTSSLPEVCGEAAVMVDPNDSDAIAVSIENMATSEKQRQELVKKGYLNVKRFSWESCALAYRKALFK